MTANKHLIKRICALALCLCLLVTLTGCTTESKYQSANKLLAEGKYAEAAEKFEALGSFEDAPLLTMYAKAAAAGEAGQFEACLQTFGNLGEFKDSPMMVTYYKARRSQASGLAAETPEQQAANRRWNDFMGAAGLYGQQLLFRDSQQRQLDCYQAAYDMAEGLAAAELFDAASEAHERLAFVRYLDSGDLYNYYAARSCEVAAPKGIAYEDQWAAEDFEQYQNAILIYDQQPLVRDSQTRAEACRQTLYAFAMECAAHEDYTNAAAIIGYAAGHPDADMLSAYWGACYLEQTGRYELAAQRFEIYADFAPEGGDTGALRAEAARQKGYDAAMALLEEGKHEDGYELLRSLGDFGSATAYIPQHEFQRAQAHLEAGEYEDALDLFEMISLLADEGVEPGYTPELGEAALLKMQESFYRYGESLYAAAKTEEDYKEARLVFLEAGDYTPEGGVPAGDRYHSLWYERGEALLMQEEPDYQAARNAFARAVDYAPEGKMTGMERVKDSWYLEGEALLAREEPDREGAKESFRRAGEYAPEGQLTGTERYNAMWYEDGERLFAGAVTEMDYSRAKNAFRKIAGYTPEGGIPAADRYASLWYEKGEGLLSQETPDYDGAYAAFLEASGGYAPEGKADGYTRAKEAMYLKGEAKLTQEEPDYDGAREAFGKAKDYAPEGGVDAAIRVKKCWYLQGEALFTQAVPDYDGAKEAFVNADDYAPEGGIPAADRYASLWYEKGEGLMAREEPDYDGAYAAFLEATGGGYAPEGGTDAATRAKEAMYLKGEALLVQETPDYDGAKTAFEAAGDYAPEGGTNGLTRAKEAMYLKGEALLVQETPDYDGAKAAFEAAGDYAPEGYADGLTRAKEAMYLKGEALLAQETPDYDGAKAAFDAAGDYAVGREAATRLDNIVREYASVGFFSDGMATACNMDGKYGYVNTKGDLVVPFVWDRAVAFSDGLGLVIMGESASRDYAFVNTQGQIVNELEGYTVVWPYSEGLAKVKNRHGQYGFINTQGEMVIPYGDWELAGSFSEGLASVCKDGKFGYIDQEGKLVISYRKYASVSDFHEGRAYVIEDKNGKYDRWGFIDTTGKEIVSPQYGAVQDFSNGYACVINDNSWGFIDLNGKLVLPLEERNGFPSRYGEGMFFTRDGYMDLSGKIVIPADNWQHGTPFEDGTAIVQGKRYFGVIDATGKYLIPCEYSIISYNDGIFTLLGKDRRLTVITLEELLAE